MLRTTSVADCDIVDSGVWFEQTEPGLGSLFLDALDKTLAHITRRPLTCPTVVFPGRNLKVQLRWCSLNRFPRVVCFEATHDEVVVYAVLHPHRDLETILVSRIGVH
jgi:hypothetical protein